MKFNFKAPKPDKIEKHIAASWEITPSKTDDLLIVRTNGKFNPEQVEKMTKETFEAAAVNGIRKILGDHRGMSLNLSTNDIYRLPRDLINHGVNMPVKIAVLFSDEKVQQQDIDFFLLTAGNVGILVEQFKDMPSAIEWLKS